MFLLHIAINSLNKTMEQNNKARNKASERLDSLLSKVNNGFTLTRYTFCSISLLINFFVFQTLETLRERHEQYLLQISKIDKFGNHSIVDPLKRSLRLPRRKLTQVEFRNKVNE